MVQPMKVRDSYEHWAQPPSELSPRCWMWVEKIIAGWKRNNRIATMGYDSAAHYFGVYIWEYIHILYPLLNADHCLCGSIL